MGREKGDGLGRKGGRKPGIPNRITGEMREVLAPIINDYISGKGIGTKARALASDLDLMDPEDRAKIITNLVPYVIPKLSSVEVKNTDATKSLKDELDEIEESTK